MFKKLIQVEFQEYKRITKEILAFAKELNESEDIEDKKIAKAIVSSVSESVDKVTEGIK